DAFRRRHATTQERSVDLARVRLLRRDRARCEGTQQHTGVARVLPADVAVGSRIVGATMATHEHHEAHDPSTYYIPHNGWYPVFLAFGIASMFGGLGVWLNAVEGGPQPN